MNFITRFESLASRRRRLQLAQVLAGFALAALVVFALLAAIDFVFEAPWGLRALMTTVAALGVIAVAGVWLLRAFVQTSRPVTAADLEATFPELGQSIRTTVQYTEPAADDSRWQGVAPSLIAALVDRTDQRTQPVPLESVAPSRRLWALTVASLAMVAFGMVVCSDSWEWQTAARRTLLADDAYCALNVEPGPQTVDEGSTAKIVATLTGRTNKPLSLWTRRQDKPDAEWIEQVLEERETTTSGDVRPSRQSVARLANLTLPFEYRVTAGDLSAGPFPITIRRPVKIDSIAVELTPPEYTKVKTYSVADGNVSALRGTAARFVFTFDKPVKSARLVFAPPRMMSGQDPPAEPESLPLQLDAPATSAAITAPAGVTELTLNDDRLYSIEAEATDGTKLAPNKYRIRVQDDQPPQISFESPRDAIEVHALAELPMRLRTRDDYGLTKAGVVFQINNEQEIPLLAEDFAVVAAAASEAAKTGEVAAVTQRNLNRLLPLEHFALTQKDSVMYYGYAEDNRPGSSQRTMTDMRFIDIRPFKRLYQIYNPDPNEGGMNSGGSGLRSLEEIIHRQRFGLNRTLQIERRAASGRVPEAGTLDQLIKYETELAANVRAFAQGLESRGFDDTALLYQAEATIIAAVDSLSVGKWETATQQMRDALKFLIEQRDRTIEAIRKNRDPAFLAGLRAFDRMQQQKLRRPKSDKEEARELLARLESLIQAEDEVARSLDDPKPADRDPMASQPEEQK